MPDVVIENPIINAPFGEPKRHFVFGDQGNRPTWIRDRSSLATLQAVDFAALGTIHPRPDLRRPPDDR